MAQVLLRVVAVIVAVLLGWWVYGIVGSLLLAFVLGCVWMVRSAGRDKGWTPLHDAAENNHLAAAEDLIRGGADVNSKTKRGVSPLYVAVVHGHKDIAELLLANRACVSLDWDDHGITPLHAAADEGRSDLAKLLIDGGANVNAKAKPHGLTPLHMAAVRGHLDCVQLLIENGAHVNARDRDGQTALDFAREAGHSEVTTILFALTFQE